MNATLASSAVSQTINQAGKQTVWHQCPAGSFSQVVDTASIGSAAGVPLTMWASDAAYDYQAGHYNSDTVTKSINIDNTPVGLSLSGPSDAPSTAGAQAITATAQAGPSGVRGVWCSIDGSPFAFHGGASEQIPVVGIGQHTASCYAENNALDESGQPGSVGASDVADDDPRADREHRLVCSGRQRAAVLASSTSASASRPAGSR